MAVSTAALDAEYGYPTGTMDRLVRAESGGRPSVVSAKGAIGLGQLEPGTAKQLGVDPWDPDQNLAGSARYLSQLRKQFGGSLPLALAAYNEGPGNLQRKGVFPSTQGYVGKIMNAAPSGALGQALGLAVPTNENDPDLLAARAAQGRVVQAGDQAAGELDRSKGAIGDVEKTLAGISARPTPEVHNLEIPKEPDMKGKDPTRALGQFLPILAILGGAASRRHSLAALEAATGAMTAQKSNDEGELKKQHEVWLDNMKRLEDMHSAEREHFDDAMKLNETDRAAAMSQLSVVAALDNNVLMKQKLAQGDMDGAVSIWKTKNEAANKVFEVARLSMEQQRLAETQRKDDWQMQHGDVNTNPANRAYNDYLEKHPGDTDGANKALRETELALKPGAGGAIERSLHNSFMKDPRVSAYTNARQFFDNLDNADITTPAGQIQVLDDYTKIVTGGKQALRGFMVKSVEDAMSLQDKAQANLQRLQAGHGGLMDARTANQYLAAAKTIREQMQKHYDEASNTYASAAKRKGADTADVILDDSEIARLSDQSPSPPTPSVGKTAHKVGDIVEHGGKKYRITGGDMSDPDVELVK